MALTGHPTVSVSRPRCTAERVDSERTVVRVCGDQDLSNMSALSDALARATHFGGTAVVVDLSRVTFMDAATLGTIVRARHVLESQSQSLILRRPAPCVRRLLDLCGIPDDGSD